jgi:glycosyltransferase involved in cell wall biosynthesis
MTKDSHFFLSIVVPVFNEEAVIEMFYQRLMNVLFSQQYRYEIIFVDDGSRDKTLAIIEMIRKMDTHVHVLSLSRNFGKEIAISAGLDYAEGDAVILIDADLQDPPEIIVKLIEEWKQGFDIVYAQRSSRKGESFIKKMTAYLFYRVLNFAGSFSIPKDTGDFRLISQRAVIALRQLRERHRFMKGLFAWVGYPQKAIYYHRDARVAGKSKWSYWRLWNLALEGITSFTIAPLKAATYFGLLTAFIAFVYGLIIIYKTLVFGNTVPGYSSLMVAILFLGGVQLLTIGIIGEYLGRMFNEVKNRPLYLLKSNTFEKIEILEEEELQLEHWED